METYLDVEGTAAYLNTSTRFVRRLVAERRIAFHKIGRHVRFAKSDVDRWITESRVEPITRGGVRRALRRAA